MGFLNRFRTTQPSKTPRGTSGRGHTDGFLALEELNVDLRGTSGLQVFDKMYRTDPDIRRSVAMVCNPIIGGTWSVEPYGGDEATPKDKEVAEFVEWALFDVMRPKLGRHLAEALPVVIRSGFAPFEQVWAADDYNGRAVLVPRTLGLRLPRTIGQVRQDDAGEITEIVQWPPTGAQVTIPAVDLVYYRIGGEGDNWEGTSLLRPVYKPWFLKDKIERLDAIAIERESTGVPIAYPPSGATDPQRDEVEAALANLRTNEQGYIVSPGPHAQFSEKGQGWVFDILSSKANEQRSAAASLEYHSSKIAAGFIAEFMRLGQAQTGARATADVQQDPFLAGVEAIAGEFEDTLNEQLVSRLVALNYEVDEPPKLSMSLVDSTSLEQLSSYVGSLVDKGVLQVDPDLEDYLRERADLPPADPAVREEKAQARQAAQRRLLNPPEPPTQPPEGDPEAAPPAAEQKAADLPEPRWGRDLRWWEKHIQLEVIDTAIGGARERFEAAAGPATRELAQTYAAVAVKGRAQMPKPGTDLEKAIGSELLALYRTGVATVEAELDAQRQGQTLAAYERPPEAVSRRAKLAAASIATRIWQAVSRSVLGKGPDLATAQAAGEAEAAAALRAEAQLHASAALNQGRSDTADANADAISGSRYTSILDKSRCQSCATADDDLLRPLDDPVRLARKPPNALCFGGDRCRCIEFFEFRDESRGTPPAPEPPPVQAIPTSPSVASHFDVTGGNAELRAIIDDQLSAIQQVHRMPAMMPRIPLKVTSMQASFGEFSGAFRPASGEWLDLQIKLSAPALKRQPPITSAVHEVGHFLDAFGFGDGAPTDAILTGGYYSATPAMAEWREAALSTNAYRSLVTGGGTPYEVSTEEVLARSYEQWIALRSGNQALAAKIAARRRDNVNLYWNPDDFMSVATAFDRLFGRMGLLGSG